MNLDDTQEILARHDRTVARAAFRAKFVQEQIQHLRGALNTLGVSDRPSKIAILQSFDAEMAYLMKIPGVAQALFDEGAP